MSAYINCPGSSGDDITTPHDASFNVTDLDVRFRIFCDSYDTLTFDVCGKWLGVGGWNSWQVQWLANNYFQLTWHNGAGNVTVNGPTGGVPANNTVIQRRVTLDVDDGASQHVVKWYSDDSNTGTWNLDETDTVGGTSSISTTASEVSCAATVNGTVNILSGGIYWAEQRASIDGATIWRMDAAQSVTGSSTWVDGYGNTWTLGGNTAKLGGLAAGSGINTGIRIGL